MSWPDVHGPSWMVTTTICVIHQRAKQNCSPQNRMHHKYEHATICSLLPRRRSADDEELPSHGEFHLPLGDLPQ